MIRRLMAICVTAFLFVPAAQAQQNTWVRLQVAPTPSVAEIWGKTVGDRVCTVSVNVKKEVRATLITGASEDLKKPWGLVQWFAPTMEAAKRRQFTKLDILGTDPDRFKRDFFRDCTDLPQF